MDEIREPEAEIESREPIAATYHVRVTLRGTGGEPLVRDVEETVRVALETVLESSGLRPTVRGERVDR